MSLVETLTEIVHTFINLDQHLPAIMSIGGWLYLILFAVVFFETGLMILSLLPGDSLLFTAGALAALGSLELAYLLALAFVATVLADSVNYAIGDRAGRRLLVGRLPFTQPHHLERTERFFTERGRLAIVLARFIPWIRSFTPFVAGMVQVPYYRFLFYNLLGAVVWVSFFALAGYFFGNVPLVRDNMALVLVGVLILSSMPAVVEVARSRMARAPVQTASSDTVLGR
jgi:membrane-associated protein